MVVQQYFDAPLFIRERNLDPVNISETPYFYNDNGNPTYVERPLSDVTQLAPARGDRKLVIGREYPVSIRGTKATEYGVETQFKIGAAEVVYEPMWATREIAAAFGMTLVEKGQAVRVVSKAPRLARIEYEYGVFAGHQSPYQGTKSRLLPVVCTDLEHHDFPHVFASVDKHLPLVLSVGRYWPDRGKICLADLWLPIGCALYVPPQSTRGDEDCLYLHGNRNAARACWGHIGQDSLTTQTLLDASDRSFHWFWNEMPTVHSNLERN